MKICYINKPQLVERSNKIEYILNEYYNSLLQSIEENPQYYKDTLALAISEPKELAKAWTLQMRHRLSSQSDDYIDWMYEEVKKESEE